MKYKYNNEQLLAIKKNKQNIAVIAGAGTGKTTVLIERIKRLIEEFVDPKTMLAITFTKKAALEMKERLNNNDIEIMTFDAFCYKIVNENNINILNDSNLFSKKALLSFNLYDANLRIGKEPKRYGEYVNYKLREDLSDFNDIEYKALRKLTDSTIDKYKYIFIDEFQDTNNLQYKIFKKLINKDTSTFIVGDPDQSIYAFRGANNKLIEQYINEFSAAVIILRINYRSRNMIIKSANNLISHNQKRIKKTLIGYSSIEGDIKIFEHTDTFQTILSLYTTLKNENKLCAILARNNEQIYLYKNYFTFDVKIRVATIHEVKGLEFDVVFLIDVNEHLFPSRMLNTITELEEERRLMFVAVTRAKESLYIFSDKKSRFIKELRLNKKK